MSKIIYIIILLSYNLVSAQTNNLHFFNSATKIINNSEITYSYSIGSSFNTIPLSISHFTENNNKLDFSQGAFVTLYPNPASDVLFVSVIFNKNYTIKIFNLQGSLYYDNHLFVGINNIDIRQLPQGVYFAELTNLENLKKERFKFIVVR